MAQYVPKAAAIDAALAANPNTLLLSYFNSSNANVDAMRVRQVVYVSPHFVPIMLAGDLTPVQAWASLLSAIISSGQEFDF